MILLTVGTQLPFDRLVAAVDTWAAAHEDMPVFGQIGSGADRKYTPEHFEAVESLPPAALAEKVAQSDLIVSHAGTGSIMSALRNRKPIIVMPREATLGEHRNDHQLATAALFEARQGVFVVRNATDLGETIDRVLALGLEVPAPPPFAEPMLIDRLRQVIMPEP